jgi:phage terminase large subunit-like protein
VNLEPIIAKLERLPRHLVDAYEAELKADSALRQRRSRLSKLFPDKDELDAKGNVLIHARHKYAKHIEFFRAGSQHTERAFMAANRVGKTVVGSYEAAVHLTGEYPHWWDGCRFDRPVDCWAGSDTGETTRDIVQLALMGLPGDYGTGAIPHKSIVDYSTRRGVTDAVDTVRVRHKSGGTSTIGFKSYDQGREKWQGTARHVIWLDEEPPADIYDEALIRTMTVDGRMMVTFTPLKGLSEVALRFMPHLAPQSDEEVKPW